MTGYFLRIFISVVFALCLNNHVVNGRLILSKEEDWELEKQLKVLNKPAIKTIWLENGDVFDCVDIYKQPSLDHPTLKNHSIQLKPSNFPGSDKFSSINKSHKIGIEFEGCPAGSVPIRRITKEELVTSKNLLNVFSEVPVNNRWAYVGTLHDGEFYGAQATMSVSNLSSIQLGQSSHAQIWVINGEADPNKINAVQVGWHVHPQLYGDSKSRFFVYWTADYYQSTGCYNLRCSGFVQLNPRITPGMELIVSSAEAHVNELTLSIFQDENTGDWWLTVGRVQEAVGYWPKSLFPELSSKANKVIWGGVASSNQNQPTPPMGSGQFASEGDGKAAYFTQTLIAYSPGSFEPLNSDEQSVYDKNKCYSVSRPDKLGELGYHFNYGGPGGC